MEGLMVKEKSCRTCRHARWEMTRHTPPRVNVARHGECACPMESRLVVMPLAVMDRVEMEMVRKRRGGGIWYDDPHCDCPTWETVGEQK